MSRSLCGITIFIMAPAVGLGPGSFLGFGLIIYIGQNLGLQIRIYLNSEINT